MIQIEITHKKLSELAKDAPALRRQHLLGLHKALDDRGDAAWSTIILENSNPGAGEEEVVLD